MGDIDAVGIKKLQKLPSFFQYRASDQIKFLANLMMTAIGLRGGKRFRNIFAGQNPQLSEDDLNRITKTFAFESN